MLNIGVLVSGGGTNLQAIFDEMDKGRLSKCRIATVVSSREDAYALERAKSRGIPVAYISKKQFSVPEEYDDALITHMDKYDVGLVVMAGFLSIVGNKFIERFSNRIINVHPSLIPSFCGKGYYGMVPHQKALEYGVKITGATVQFVTLDTDAGPIILQKAVCIDEDDTPETLQKKVMREAEWVLLPEAIRLFSEGRLSIEGNRVKIIH
jgi:phosphoribosylglycinamide formyltransferase 1